MSEIAWLVNLMMNYKLDDAVKKICLERISEVEARATVQPVMAQFPSNYQPPIQTLPFQVPQQAPSTLARMAAHEMQASPIKQLTPATEIITSSGNGTSTRGPNKLRGRL